MRPAKSTGTTRLEDLDDVALVERARQRDGAAFWLIMKRHNQRLYRVARAVLGDDAEVEDVIQETYLRALAHLSEFRREARLSTWLTRIALNEALALLRKRRPHLDLHAIETDHDPTDASTTLATLRAPQADPEAAATLAEISATHGRCRGPPRRALPYCFRDAGYRGNEHRRNGSPSRLATPDGQDKAISRA